MGHDVWGPFPGNAFLTAGCDPNLAAALFRYADLLRAAEQWRLAHGTGESRRCLAAARKRRHACHDREFAP